MSLLAKVQIIAEAGVNHNGSLDMACELVAVAAKARADVVKFQTFRSESVVSRHAEKAKYQLINTGTKESQLEMVRKLELSVSDHETLIKHATEKGIQFLSTPFDLDSLDLLANRFNLPQLKIPSGEITNLPLLVAAGRTNKPIIMSTGMATIGEVEQALAVLAFAYTSQANERPTTDSLKSAMTSLAGRRALQERVSLLHCTTEYPAPADEINLRAMDTLRAAFNLPVGYSDHSAGTHVSVAAVALGATIIEKHFTLDRNLPGPDHVASLEPAELTEMVASIREVSRAMGNGIKQPTPSELKNIVIARKSLVAATSIKEGEFFSAHNLTTKRPGSGVSAMQYERYLHLRSSRSYEPDELIDEQ